VGTFHKEVVLVAMAAGDIQKIFLLNKKLPPEPGHSLKELVRWDLADGSI
jgi:hypothetical protein